MMMVRFFFLLRQSQHIGVLFTQVNGCYVNSTLQHKDGSYTGFIKVHFQLVRPISLPPQSLSSGQTQDEGQRDNRMKRRTSFYLPKDTVKHLHISSQTKVQDVIVALLNKFTVVDNPAKFALFERTERQNQGTEQ